MPTTTVTREVYYSPQHMFDLVADVERYPEFLPTWQAVRVRNRRDDGYDTDQVVRLGPVRHTFTTHTALERPGLIRVVSTQAPFRVFELHWNFNVADDGGCRISLDARFELRYRALSALGALLSRDSVDRMITSFEDRARDLYGPPAHASHE
ncbi:type II toxin-antitoxin system RatA family toxin [Novispirillum sp. DQ9]|uniref:type II toxin-antitoxin system RatA family toxin n=1 Tax=Novispirillum sp. DQ9 TaxID=3398612 RepID=UPI003C7B1401